MSSAPEFSDEAVALSELISKWKVEDAIVLADQIRLAHLQKTMALRQARMSALVDAADKIVQSMSRGRPTYTVKDLL